MPMIMIIISINICNRMDLKMKYLITVSAFLLVACSTPSIPEIHPTKVIKYAPVYPPQAVKDRKTGFVTLQYDVNDNGVVRNLKILQSRPEGYFENSALTAVQKWRFMKGAPYRNVTTTIRYQLTRDITPLPEDSTSGNLGRGE